MGFVHQERKDQCREVFNSSLALGWDWRARAVQITAWILPTLLNMPGCKWFRSLLQIISKLQSYQPGASAMRKQGLMATDRPSYLNALIHLSECQVQPGFWGHCLLGKNNCVQQRLQNKQEKNNSISQLRNWAMTKWCVHLSQIHISPLAHRSINEGYNSSSSHKHWPCVLLGEGNALFREERNSNPELNSAQCISHNWQIWQLRESTTSERAEVRFRS